MSWAAFLGQLVLPVALALLATRIGQYWQLGNPLFNKGLILWLGHALDIGKDAATFLSDMRKKHGDIFTIQAAGKICHHIAGSPFPYDVVLRESHSKLDFKQYAQLLMDRMFGLGPSNRSYTETEAPDPGKTAS
ncbi:hypothetical protein JRQ81_003057 [Phrynocephalus forsythii]|uniref:Cytochrome P450 n=1 Tax=Phrynocephalus forsythii TaxID=171643 RepID=A0A9Q0XK28_9SAUR|nr:hypothetical protein JRQ81_003057 [Phrynocephalus forsythii]